MLTIHDFKGFPNPLRVRIAVEEKNLSDRVQFKSVDVPGGEHRSPAFLARNPSGSVPVLELEDGTHISESSAIIEYLDQFDGTPTLTGQGARERSVIHMTQRLAESEILDAVGAYFHHATEGLGPQLETYQNADWGHKQRERALAGMRRFDKVLATQPWFAGATFSIADITAFAGLVFADFAKIEVPEDCPNLIAWRKRMAERPAVVAAL